MDIQGAAEGGIGVTSMWARSEPDAGDASTSDALLASRNAGRGKRGTAAGPTSPWSRFCFLALLLRFFNCKTP